MQHPLLTRITSYLVGLVFRRRARIPTFPHVPVVKNWLICEQAKKRPHPGDFTMRANKTFLVSTLVGALLTGVAGVALAQGGHEGPGGHHGMRGPQDLFEKFDLNKDGEITREEMETARDARFAETDANGDGSISADEMQAAMAARVAQHQQAMFEHLDANKDGSLSAEEMQAGPRGERPGKMFDRADANDDGKITREEADAMHEKMEEHRGHRGGCDD